MSDKPNSVRRAGRRRPIRESGQPKDLVDGCVEVVARMTDTAEDIVAAGIDHDPRYGARTSGDVVRQTPHMLSKAAYALNDGLVQINEGIVDLLDLRTWDRWRRDRSGSDFADPAPRSRAVSTERDVVAAARRFMDAGRYRGATLDGLLRHLRPRYELSDEHLQQIISRYFLVDGDLVFPAASQRNGVGAVPDSVAAHLRALGYDDLRAHVNLERAGSGAPPARMVAYDAGAPKILVCMVSAEEVEDPRIHEDVRFQAKALSKSEPPRFVYLTDGRVNRYLDLEEDRLMSMLPRAGAAS